MKPDSWIKFMVIFVTIVFLEFDFWLNEKRPYRLDLLSICIRKGSTDLCEMTIKDMPLTNFNQHCCNYFPNRMPHI